MLSKEHSMSGDLLRNSTNHKGGWSGKKIKRKKVNANANTAASAITTTTIKIKVSKKQHKRE